MARATGYRMDMESETFVVASTMNGGEVDGQTAPLVGGDGPHGRSTFNGMDTVVADKPPSGMGVRRLTPLECERLQGFPDGWTDLQVDGKPIADSHRYRMLGNAVATVCAQWIGHRLARVDARRD